MNLFKKDKGGPEKGQAPPAQGGKSHPDLQMLGGRAAPKPTAPQASAPQQNVMLSDVQYKIAIASGKGGVGKSTVATNLALALAQGTAKVGLMDADAYGPSIPTMMGINKQPEVGEDRKLIPLASHDIKLMSIGFMVSEEQAMIWRGPMLHSAIRQFLSDVNWGVLDYLIIDLPPGTGDAALSLTQAIPLTGAVIVTTPQDVALADVRRGVAMFEKLNVPILGVVENMSYFICPHCDNRTDIFRADGGKRISEKLDVPFLGAVPIDAEICTGGDLGVPIVASHPDSAQSGAFRNAANLLEEELRQQDPESELEILG